VHLGAVESSLGGQAARNGADRFEPKKQGKMGWGSGRARGQESMEGGGPRRAVRGEGLEEGRALARAVEGSTEWH
jgi:hypothetical protein